MKQLVNIQKYNQQIEMSETLEQVNAMVQFAKTFEDYRREKLSIERFADGHIFATMLRSATNFGLKYGDIIENCEKWTFRLNNLKKIIGFIEDYFQEQIKKGVKTRDIDLIQIAKNYNIQQTLKLFQLVVAVLTQSPNKEDHINTIMSLDEKSQASFVWIIQNLLQNRILDKNETKQDKIMQTMSHLEIQNTLLRNQVESLLNQNHLQNKQIKELKNRVADYLEEISRLRDQEMDKSPVAREEPRQKEHLRNMIDNLKQKLMSTVRQSEIKISGLKEEIHILQSKCMKYEEIQQQLQDYKRKYNETIESYGRAKLWEREKSKLMRNIDEKEDTIKKLNAKLDQINQLNYSMQEREVYAKMELEKRDVRFKQLEKRYGTTGSLNLIDNNPTSSKSLQLRNVTNLGYEINEIDQEQIEELRAEIDQFRKKNRESQRQINRLKRNLQKAANFEADKKKLQRVIVDLHTQKREQVEVLLSTTYDFYSQNYKLRNLLIKNGISV